MKYLFLDTETGGIGLDKSLLTIGLVFTDEEFNVVYDYHARVKPDDGIYNVSATALEINKINLVEHDKLALTCKETGGILYNILKEYSKDGKIIVFGKNVYFDLTHIWDKIIKRSTWEQFCSYQIVDLTSIWKFLELTKKVPKLEKTSLSDIANYLKLDCFNTNYMHEAIYDATITMRCFKEISIK